MTLAQDRTRLVDRVRQSLERSGRPRAVMMTVLSVSFAAGFLASVAMVHLGVRRMPIRYPLAVGVGYATFLALLWAWLRRQSPDPSFLEDPTAGDADLPVVALGVAAVLAGEAVRPEERPSRKATTSAGGVSDLGDLGENLGGLIVIVLLAGGCTLIVSIYLIVASPMLLAELLVDGALLGAMSRAISPDSPPHWSSAILRRTWIPALVTAVTFGLAGFGIEQVAPGAHTLGQAWAAENARR